MPASLYTQSIELTHEQLVLLSKLLTEFINSSFAASPSKEPDDLFLALTTRQVVDEEGLIPLQRRNNAAMEEFLAKRQTPAAVPVNDDCPF